MAWSDLVENLVAEGILKSPEIVKAFNKVDRKDFVKKEDKGRADIDRPLKIGFGQTISQPMTVAFMLQLLQPEEGMKVLDIGSGSGWTSALLAQLVGNEGRVYAVEKIPQLVKFGRENSQKAGYDDITFIQSNGSLGLKKKAPFDRILTSATVPEIPQDLKDQLSQGGGRLVIPVGDITSSIYLVKRKDKNTYTQKEHPGFSFVPLKGRKGF